LPTQRQVRILELREYAKKNYDRILQNAEKEIREAGYVRTDERLTKLEEPSQPCLHRRGMWFRRPWGDFLLILTDLAMKWYYVTEETGKSYARIALEPFARELLPKYRKTREISNY
jgi:hypothetical protein